jgi:mono/diheme cytochrome c family protein
MRRSLQVAVSVVAVFGLSGCERAMKDMYVQPKLGPDAASPLFADGKSSRPPPAGSVPMAMGDLAKTSSGRRGQQELAERDAADAASTMPPTTSALLQRGQARYDIYCAPCHSPVGDGDGMIARRGFPRPPSYHLARLRESSDRHFFDVITQGYGVMLPYADRVTPQDRWAIVAYIRALQASQDVPLAHRAPSLRAAMAGLARSAPAGAVPQGAAASAATPPGPGASASETS